MNIALFDLDNSLADYSGALVRDMKLLQSPDEEPITEENIWLLDKQKHIGNRMKLIKSLPGWWRNLEPIPAGLQIFNLCKEIGYRNHILTKAPKKHSRAWREKVEWSQNHIDEDVDINLSSDKSMVNGTVLYDDFQEYMLEWLKNRPTCLGIMPVNSYNKDFYHPQVVMWNGENLEEVRAALLTHYE